MDMGVGRLVLVVDAFFHFQAVLRTPARDGVPRNMGFDAMQIDVFYLQPQQFVQGVCRAGVHAVVRPRAPSRAGYSFLAFNKFPGHLLHRSVSWTGPIEVWKPPRTRYWRWTVTIQKLTIHLIADKNYQRRDGYEDKDLLMDFGSGGERFHVDTGSSTTMFTQDAMLILKRAFDNGNPYSVPEWVDLQKSTVEYTFASGESTEDVVFVTPARRFICDKHRQGLIWTSVKPGRPQEGDAERVTRCVLGLNFFHSAVVAMHRPQPGSGTPYVRFGTMARPADPSV